MRIAVLTGCLVLLGACDGSATDTAAVSSTSTQPSTTTTAASGSTSTTATTSTTAPESVDLVYTGGDVVTMDSAIGTTEAIAIDGDVIVAVGTTAEIDRYVGQDTRVVELDGRSVLPGFVDAHTHILTDMGGIEAGQALALENGITSLGDASIEEGLPEQFVDAANSGQLRIRSTLYLARTDPCGVDQGRWYEAFAPNAELADRVRVGGVKIFEDGGVCGAIAASKPFLDGYVNGAPYHDPDVLTEWISEANDAGYQVIIHAQGDLAIAEVLDAYAAVLDGGDNVLRHRIEHNALVTPDLAVRYGEIGIIPTVFGVSAACNPEGWTDFYKAYGDRPNLIASANPGLVVSWHGDDPWLAPVSPILELFSLVTRANMADDGTVCEPPEWMVDGAVSVEDGLAMMTTNSAYALGVEDVVGSLTPGKLADLLVVSDNPLTIASDMLPSVEVLATVIGGVTEFCSPGSEELCPGFAAPEGQTASASVSREGHGPELVLDGSVAGESFWSSGADPAQWIEVEMPIASTISEIRFVVFQNPEGRTVHELELLVDGTWEVVETFSGVTATGDVLTWHPATPVTGVEAFRMTTLESLSWPEWFEIETDAVPTGP
jgi:predicted amidohydrolase YtcJ